LVIKILGKKSLRLRSEAATHILGEPGARLALDEVVDEELLFGYLYRLSFQHCSPYIANASLLFLRGRCRKDALEDLVNSNWV
jgi:hypothetical protein